MIQYAQNIGIRCTLEEMQDRCNQPYDALGTMRNEAWLKAAGGGYEFILYLDNDVLPREDTLVRLIRRQQPVIVPWIEEPPKPTGEPLRILHGPVQQAFYGQHKIKWSVLSFMLWNVNVLRSFGGIFWSDAIGADEGFHFQRLYYQTGIQPMIDTEVVVPIFQPPTYPLTASKMAPEEGEAFWQGKKDWLWGPADRKPVNPNDPRVDANGNYLPFLPVPPAPVAPVQPAEVMPDPVCHAALKTGAKEGTGMTCGRTRPCQYHDHANGIQGVPSGAAQPVGAV
jgi:hypothetical protein